MREKWRFQALWWQRHASAKQTGMKDTWLFLLSDVKPSNVLINTLGQVKMCDFGISGYLVDSVAKTIDAGCKPYMAVSTAAGAATENAIAGQPCQGTGNGWPQREN